MNGAGPAQAMAVATTQATRHAAAQTTTRAPAVAIQDLRCVIDGRTILAIERLLIEPGERVALIGPNGAGKSTLLRVLGGFHRPAHGQVDVLGRRLDQDLRGHALRALRRDVGQIFQGPHLVMSLSALDNVALGACGRLTGPRDVAASWFRRWTGEVATAARDALAATGMGASVDVPVGRLSGGERQKIAIARLLVQRPRLVLADEPTAHLDPASAQIFGTLLAAFTAEVTTVTVVHDTTIMAGLGSRVIGLRDGRVAFDRPVAAVDRAELDALYR